MCYALHLGDPKWIRQIRQSRAPLELSMFGVPLSLTCKNQVCGGNSRKGGIHPSGSGL